MIARMKHYVALALALLAPCSGDDTEGTFTVGDASTNVPIPAHLRAQNDGCVPSLDWDAAVATFCPKPEPEVIFPEKIEEPCLPIPGGGGLTEAKHTFEGMTADQIATSVSQACVLAERDGLGYPFALVNEAEISNDGTVRVLCRANTRRCTAMVFLKRGNR